jgi:protein-S-isoprenylcysteine O-methyltransferase Ste14
VRAGTVESGDGISNIISTDAHSGTSACETTMNKFRLILSVLRAIVGTVMAMLVWRWWVEPLVASLDARWPVVLPSIAQWLGWPMIAGALALIASAEWTFLTVGGATGTPGDVPHRLVAHGPYRWLRNPLYLSGSALFFGIALVAKSPTILTLALAWAIGLHSFVMLIEEPQLERRYGASYREYKRTVPRWIPRRPQPERGDIAGST